MEERPKDLSSKQLRFHRQAPVRWMSQRVLASTAARVILAKVLGAYLDKREFQALLKQDVFDHTDRDELWLDYVADVGDGFDSTYTIAYLTSRPSINPGEELPRGDILVMGGDQVYPAANWRDYENRCRGPYQAAMPTGNGHLYAIPGNHDWYDGLTSFLRVFGQQRNIGGRQTRQARSYFAVRLPHRWWLLGIDAQFDEYLDGPQLDYFAEALETMEPGDPVILCVPRPAWTWTDADPRAFDRVDYFIRTFIKPKGGTVPVVLTGDRHHYAHYRELGGPRHLITAGGGGAYLSPTHNLPDLLQAPPPDSMARHGSPVRTYEAAMTYPSKRESWRYAAKVFWRLPWLNFGFVVLLGLIHLLGLLSFLGTPGTAVAAAAGTFGITVAFAHPSNGDRKPRHWVAAACHAAGHLGLTAAGTAAWSALELSGWEAYLAYVPVSGLAASIIVSAYLFIAGGFGVNDNELFAGQSIDDAKCFLRMRLAADGLTIYPIAVPKVGRQWDAHPDGALDEPWIVPRQPIPTRFIEKPFTIPGHGRR
ncbi:metallophosphoesterase family protein [Stackebrandtia soli]|uniref:metallophosphoesterase family protein n=1 Tax=Stackebrandtia soli TaxID=1892856 RepID=UPI0039ECA206